MKLKKASGFTLLEAIIALLILTVLILAFAYMLTSTTRTIYRAGQKTVAEFFSQEELEKQLSSIAESVNADISITTSEATSFTIDFTSDAGIEITSSGIVYEVEYDDGKSTVYITTFQPYK